MPASAPRGQRFGAWLALFGLVAQVFLSTAHSASHFDHLLGALGTADLSIAADASRGEPDSPPPIGPGIPGLDRCAVGLGLAAGASVILADAGPLLLPSGAMLARLEEAATPLALIARRHSLPPARAPPVIEMSA